MEKKKNGGARPGAGRPRGSTNRVTARELLETADLIVGKPFVVTLLEGYRDSIYADDKKLRTTYEKMILDKVATTLVEAEISDSKDAIAAKQAAFAEALAALAGKTRE